MNHVHRTLAAIAILLAIIMCGCSRYAETVEHKHGDGEHDRGGREHDRGARSEHDRDGDGHHGEEGEESGAEFALTETYDEIRHGARLILAYDAESNSFQGTVENTTDETLERVRVEVHLSNGRELGPTTPGDLEPGEKREINLTTTSRGFDGWSAHPEVGNREHGHGEEHGGHDREGGEYDREGWREHEEEHEGMRSPGRPEAHRGEGTDEEMHRLEGAVGELHGQMEEMRREMEEMRRMLQQLAGQQPREEDDEEQDREHDSGEHMHDGSEHDREGREHDRESRSEHK